MRIPLYMKLRERERGREREREREREPQREGEIVQRVQRFALHASCLPVCCADDLSGLPDVRERLDEFLLCTLLCYCCMCYYETSVIMCC